MKRCLALIAASLVLQGCVQMPFVPQARTGKISKAREFGFEPGMSVGLAGVTAKGPNGSTQSTGQVQASAWGRRQLWPSAEAGVQIMSAGTLTGFVKQGWAQSSNMPSMVEVFGSGNDIGREAGARLAVSFGPSQSWHFSSGLVWTPGRFTAPADLQATDLVQPEGYVGEFGFGQSATCGALYMPFDLAVRFPVALKQSGQFWLSLSLTAVLDFDNFMVCH